MTQREKKRQIEKGRLVWRDIGEEGNKLSAVWKKSQ